MPKFENKKQWDMSNFAFNFEKFMNYCAPLQFGEQLYVYWGEKYQGQFINFTAPISYAQRLRDFSINSMRRTVEDYTMPIIKFSFDQKTTEVLTTTSKLGVLYHHSEEEVAKSFLVTRCYNNSPEYGIYVIDAVLRKPPEFDLDEIVIPDPIDVTHKDYAFTKNCVLLRGSMWVEVKNVFYWTNTQDFLSTMIQKSLEGADFSKFDMDLDYIVTLFPQAKTVNEEKPLQVENGSTKGEVDQIVDKMKDFFL